MSSISRIAVAFDQPAAFDRGPCRFSESTRIVERPGANRLPLRIPADPLSPLHLRSFARLDDVVLDQVAPLFIPLARRFHFGIAALVDPIANHPSQLLQLIVSRIFCLL